MSGRALKIRVQPRMPSAARRKNLAHDNLTQDPIGTSPHPSPAQVNNDAAREALLADKPGHSL